MPAVLRRFSSVVATAIGWTILMGLSDLLSKPHPDLVVAFAPGLLLALLLALPPSSWAGILAGTLAGHVAGSFVIDLSPGLAVAFGAGLILPPLITAIVLRRIADLPFRLDSTLSTAQFVMTTLVSSAGVMAVVGTFVSAATSEAVAERTVRGWLAVVTGVLVLTPLVLTIAELRGSHRRGRRAEKLLIYAMATGVTLWVFDAGASTGNLPPQMFLLFPLLIYAGMRFPAVEVRLLTFGIAILCSAFTAAGNGPFAPGAELGGLDVLVDRLDYGGLQAYLAVLALSALLLSSLSTERISSETARVLSERRLQATLASSPVGLVMLDSQGRIERANRAFCQLVGRPVSVLMGIAYDDLPNHATPNGLDGQPADDSQPAPSTMELLRSGGRSAQENDVRFVRPDGTETWGRQYLTPLWGEVGRIDGALIQVEDVTERKAAEELLTFRATHDRLTGLANRETYGEHLERALARARRQGSMVAVSFFDLDGFKAVNDVHGHLVGDDLLREVAERLRAVVRPEDLICRYGGDEFVICSEDLYDPEHAAHLADRVLEAVNRPFQLGELVVSVGASVGVALSGRSEARAETIVADADAAMYRAKKSGGNRVEVYDPDRGERTERDVSIERELARALERGQLRLLYQPIIDLEQRCVVGVEALLRWNHPQRGVMVPEAFLAAAESSGLIHRVGDWVMRTACDDARAWKIAFAGQPLPTLHVNVSVVQLADPLFFERTLETLAELGVAPEELCLEVPAGAISDSTDPVVLEALEALTASGIGIALDDVEPAVAGGLRGLPHSALKLDRSWTTQAADDPDGTSAVSAAVATALAEAADDGVDVIAKGVETVEQLDQLVRLGGTKVQGYLLSRPRPPASVAKLSFGGLATAAALWVPHDSGTTEGSPS